MLLISYVLPYIAPKSFPVISLLSLAVPILIILNLLFAIYWLLKFKKQVLLSVVVLLIGYKYVGSFYKFSGENITKNDKSISVMNYNVRLFNVYNWIDKENVADQIENLIKTEQPDILVIQEYHPHKDVNLSHFKHKFEKLSGNRIKYGQAIYSMYPIVNSGSVEFPNTANNAIFADVLIDSDTIRVYNIHLQSSHLTKDVDYLNSENSERVFRTLKSTFIMQQEQADLFNKHKSQCPHRIIISGDFNNTAYSYVYKQIKGDFLDSFEEAGKGFGKTFDFKFFPTRIDFILVDNDFKVNGFKSFNEKLSDHYPILAKVSLKE